jgi:isoleucyl-tRNA synthetase
VARTQLLNEYLLLKTDELITEVTQAFEAFEFHRFHHLLQNFCATELSSLYCDINKDILYCDSVTSSRRIACQAVLWRVTDVLMRLIAPVMPHLAEDIFQALPENLKLSASGPEGEAPETVSLIARMPSKSIHLLDFPKPVHSDFSTQHPFEHVLALREQVNALLESARAAGHIGSALEAQVILTLPESHPLAAKVSVPAFLNDLATYFIVSQVHRGESSSVSESWKLSSDDAAITVQAAEGQKCERCWQYQPEVGQKDAHPTLCTRCVTAVIGLSLK